MARGILFVLSAPSGAGKSTLIARAEAVVGGLGFSVSHTTRAPRQGELDGVHYWFTERAAFRRLVEEGAFAEWAEVHGNLYGTSFKALGAVLDRGLDVLLDVDVQGALQLRQSFEEAVSVFVLPPCWSELRDRLASRGLDAEEVIEGRIRNARAELAEAHIYDYIIVNDDLERATAELAAIITAERCRTNRRAALLDPFKENQDGPSHC